MTLEERTMNKYGEAIGFIEYLLKNQEHLKTALKSLELMWRYTLTENIPFFAPQYRTERCFAVTPDTPTSNTD